MNECKCGRIPPCYGGKKFRIHEELEKIKAGDETRDRVYELKKQIGDFERRLSDDFLDMQVLIADKLAKDVIEGVKTPAWAKDMLAGIPEQLSRAEYEILEEILKEKNRFMEENKKRMTKAEAFEWLKCKKVDASYDECSVQSKLFSLGVVWWSTLNTNPCPSVKYLLIDKECRMSHCVCDLDYYKSHCYEEISAEDILSIEIVEEEKYELEFNYDKVVELAKPLMHYLNEVGCPDGIRVSQLGIVHEPMSTLIFDNGIGRIE